MTTATQIWCVLCIPIKHRDDATVQRDIKFLLDGPGTTDFQRICWVAKAMNGLDDHRTPCFSTRYQRLVVFHSRKAAAKHAKECTNEFWRGVVRQVRVEEGTA